MSTASNGFRKARYTHDDGTDYGTIFTAEYAGREFASDTYATPDTVVQEGDVLVVAAETNRAEAFAELT